MRNLKNTRYSVWRSPPEHQRRQIAASAWDSSDDSIIAAYGPSENDSLIELVRVTKGVKSYEHSLITSWDAPSPNPELACDQIVCLHYFSDSGTACLILAGGDIVVVREHPLLGEDRIEIVGSVDAGITAAKWSPDEELLVITTNANTLIFMSRMFEGVMDTAMTSEDLKASNHVSVGWGKKETQFKGRGAKAMRDPTMPEKIDEGVLSPDDGGEVTITWRGDGAFVAISSIEGATRRLIRVYSRDGVLDSVSEPVDGLEGALSWRPAGNLMAGVQRLSNRVDIVFFERNGLRHGQFSLRMALDELTGKHIRLAWNNDSSVLAVILGDIVQLWTMGNYHWYLKQELDYSAESILSINPVVWHPEKPLLLSITQPDSIVPAEYTFAVARSSTTPPNDYGAVAVIDGKNLKVTPFRLANVPPPMALHEVEVSHNVVDVAFSADCSLVAVLHTHGIALYVWKITPSVSLDLTLTARVTFKKENSVPSIAQQICFGNGNIVSILQFEDGTEPVVRNYGFNDDSGRMEDKSLPMGTMKPALMVGSYVSEGQCQSFAQALNGDLFALAATATSLTASKIPPILPQLEITEYNGEQIAFGLSANGHLYADSKVLVKNCTSFILTPAHLIFTTTTHFLKFVHMTSVQDLEIPADDPEKDERCRSIERGARLITSMPTLLSVVLQMPRGNLETIFPRAMILAGIRRLIDEKNYKRAFAHCRTQRVDMNILYDHAPDQLAANISLFIDQVKKISYIDLFLSSLRDEDVTETMYKETKRLPKLVSIPQIANGVAGDNKSTAVCPIGSTGKTNRICDLFLEVLRSRTNTNLQNIITANVSKSPLALDDGLTVVADLMASNEALAEKAVEHICFLADANKLYDNALGLYNLDLALLVAQQSQKDPREYLPFLQALQEMQPLRRKFSIDNHLARHRKALVHLHVISKDSPEELDNYVVKHNLYQQALGLYRYDAHRHSSIMNLYATYLESNSQFHSAAIAYESLRFYKEASNCYQRAGPSFFQETLYCATQQLPPIPSEAIAQLASTLADSLYESKDYLSSASLQTKYLHNISEAVKTLCKGYHFSNALLLCVQNNQPDLLVPNGVLDNGLSDSLSSSLELLAECKSQLLAQLPRIRELREKALADPLAFYEGEVNDDLPDDVSVAASSRVSTSASLFTRYTGRQSAGTAATGVSRQTSKNRRREERKRARGKKGSVYEEEYLVASVGRLIDRIENVREDIRRLVEALVRRGMREQARSVEALLAEVVTMCQSAVKEIYVEEDREEPVSDGSELVNEYRPTGGDAVLAESIELAGRKKIAPVVKSLEGLTILGL